MLSPGLRVCSSACASRLLGCVVELFEGLRGQRGPAQLEPGAVRAELGLAFAAYDAERERCTRPERSLARAAMAAGRLYADILRIHPFADGNLRGALPALQAALVSLGSPMVHFEAAVAEHDEALGWALRADAESRTVEPFVELLLSRIRASGNPATE